MKKLFSLICGLLILTMVGCGVETVPETTAPPETVFVEVPYETEADSRPYVGVNLTFCAALEENAPEAQVLTQAAEVFEKQTGALVTFQWADGQKAAVQTLADGTADIVRLPLDALADHAAQLLDLTEMAAQADYEAHSFAALRQQVLARCGVLGAIPQVPNLTGIYYNADAFRACGILQTPVDWDSFLSLCEGLAADGWLPMALNNEDTALALKLQLGTDTEMEATRVVELGEQILNLLDAGYVKLGAAPAGQNKLALSNVAMTIGSNTLCRQVEQAARAELNWGVFPWPGEDSGSYVFSEVLGISGSCENPQAAFDFVMLVTTGEFDQLRADITGGIPADPNNECVIAGAVEALSIAAAGEYAPYSEAQAKVALKLWTGKYKSGKAFASVWVKTE